MHSLPKIQPRKGKLKQFASSPLYYYDSKIENWTEYQGEFTSRSADRLTIATFNVLFDIYQPELLFTDERRTKLIEELQALDADIIGLQEVTQPLIRELMSVPWIRAHYYLTDIARDDDQPSPTVHPYGQLILAKHPFKPIFHEFSEYSKVIAGEFEFNNQKFVLPVVHLSSDKNKPLLFAAQRRAEQINIVLDYLKNRGDESVLIMGDFNFKDEAEVLNVPHNFIDVWRQLNPTDPGYTYDPIFNTMAAVTTTYGKKNRFDRLYLTVMSEWRPIVCELFAHKPFSAKNGNNTLYASDHYGIKTVLTRTTSSEDRLVAPRPQLSHKNRTLYLDRALEWFVIDRHIVAPEVTLRKMEKASGKLKHMLKTLIDKSKFKMRHIGSVQLGVVLDNTVIDIMIIGFIPKAEFFEKLMKAYTIKKDPDQDLNALDSLAMDRAGCPVNIVYCYIPVNYTFDKDFKAVNVPQDVVSAMDKQSFYHFRKLFDCDMITTHVQNLKAFNGAASFVKYWAKKYDLYGPEKLMGMTVNTMIAKLCIEHETATSDWILVLFFETFANLDWFDNKTVISITPTDWQPTEDCLIAAVLTPASPYLNLTKKISKSTMKLIVAELKRVNNIIQDALNNQRTIDWQELL